MKSANCELIENFVDYIENSLKSNISLDELSKQLCLSKYHLHRLLKSLTGTPLMAYVRARKLTSSLNELLETDLNIIDIANEYCFDYEQSYLRAFKRQFGISPAAYRKEKCELSVVNKLDTNMLVDVSDSLLIKPRYILRPQFHLLGVPTFIVHQENEEIFTANKSGRLFYHHDRMKIKECVINEHIYYGLCIYGEDYTYGNFYMPSVEVKYFVENDDYFTCKTLPKRMYAVFRYIGFHSPDELNISCMREVYNYIGEVWRTKTNNIQSAGYHFEYVDLKRCSNTYCEADIYIPV